MKEIWSEEMGWRQYWNEISEGEREGHEGRDMRGEKRRETRGKRRGEKEEEDRTQDEEGNGGVDDGDTRDNEGDMNTIEGLREGRVLVNLAKKLRPLHHSYKILAKSQPSHAHLPTQTTRDWLTMGGVKSHWWMLGKCGRGLFAKVS